MCQLFISKDFETSLLTLLGVSLVLWRRKADNEHSNPLFYGPSPLNSQHLHFQCPIASLSKIFVRSRRDWEKKCREGSRHSPSTNRYGCANSCILSVPFCIVMPTHGKGRGWGNFCWGGRGNRKHEMMMMWGWWWNDSLFTFFIQWHSWELEGNTYCSLFCFCFENFALLLAYFALEVETKSLGRLGKDGNLGAPWNYLRRKRKNMRTLRMFAPNLCAWRKNMRPLKNVRAKPLRLMKMYAAFEKWS